MVSEPRTGSGFADRGGSGDSGVHVADRQEGEGKAGIKCWVVDAGVSGKVGRESTQKVTMQLTPLDAARKPLRVDDEEQQRQQQGSRPSTVPRGGVEAR